MAHHHVSLPFVDENENVLCRETCICYTLSIELRFLGATLRLLFGSGGGREKLMLRWEMKLERRAQMFFRL